MLNTGKWIRRAAVLFLVSLLPLAGPLGCCTTAVWDYGRMKPHGFQLQKVLVSQTGDVCVICSLEQRHRVGVQTEETVGGFERCVLLSHEEVNRLAKPRLASAYPVIDADDIRRRIRPGVPSALSFDEDALAQKTEGWKELPVANISLESLEKDIGPEPIDTWNRREWTEKRQQMAKDLVDKARNSGAALKPFGEDVVEVPWFQKRIALQMAFPSGVSPWSYPLRIILTPPAALIDVVAMAAMMY
jgi:hypothetical protein